MTKRISIFGTQVSVTNIQKAPGQIQELAKKEPGYICLPDGYVIVSATKNKKLQGILNNSLITFPDGSPLVMYAKRQGEKELGSVSGFWLVKELMKTELSHYFYGSSDKELAKIKENLSAEFPEAKIAGFKSPPWVKLEDIETNAALQNDFETIQKIAPDIIWIGMNSPKQDYLMAHYSTMLPNSILIGIGGVYDYLSGSMTISPEWVKKIGLRWVYRVAQNPKRIFKKAVIAIFGFSLLYIRELITGKTNQ